MKLSVDTSVREFLVQINWDNRPIQTDLTIPFSLRRVEDVMATIPWTGDPLALIDHSVQAALSPEWVAELEDTITLSELSALF
ncbi:MAG: hypothetical protein OHK0012_07980 [Synechococcales cyanobacterium]